MWQFVSRSAYRNANQLTTRNTHLKINSLHAAFPLGLSYPFAKVEGGKREDEGRYQKSEVVEAYEEAAGCQ